MLVWWSTHFIETVELWMWVYLFSPILVIVDKGIHFLVGFTVDIDCLNLFVHVNVLLGSVW